MLGRSKYVLVEMRVIAVCAVVYVASRTLLGSRPGPIRIDWLRRFLPLENGVPSHDTLGRLFGLLDRRAVEKRFRAWVSSVLPALPLVSAFATEATLVLGQEACAEKSNELSAIPALLEALMLKGVIVTIDAMGTHSNVAQAIRDKQADYVLAVKDNQPTLAESITTFFEIGQAEGWKHTPYSYVESIEKDHGRLECTRCWAFNQLDCLANPQQWPDLKMFGVIEAQRTINGKTRCERRLYIGSITAEAATLANAVRAHWGVENRLHWCLDVAFNDDQMRAREKNAGANLATVRRLVLNLFRLDKSSRKGGIYTRRILAASSDSYRARVLGLETI